MVSYLTRIREQLGAPPVEVPYKENSEDADEPTEAAEGPRPRHCAICKAEMDYVGGTHRPSARRVMNLLWDDIVLAVDVHPEHRSVGFHPALAGQRSAPAPVIPAKRVSPCRRRSAERAGRFGCSDFGCWLAVSGVLGSVRVPAVLLRMQS